jgi:hypothetical protein
MGDTKMKWQEDLLLDIRYNDERLDNQDTPIDYVSYDGRVEFSNCNRNSLLEYFLKVRDNCKAILEIGVCRNAQDSSTYVFLNNKLDTTSYVGIDLDDKSFLNDEFKKIYTLRANSSDVDKNMEYCTSIGVNGFDFIFIDGWHSVNQVLQDWEYTRYLSKHGIVGFHDTSAHPGPKKFMQGINRMKWHVVPNTCTKDWGIGFVWQR